MIDPRGPFSPQQIQLPKWLWVLVGISAILILISALLTTSRVSSEKVANPFVGRFFYMDTLHQDEDVTFYMKGVQHQGIQYNAGSQYGPIGLLVSTLEEDERAKITFKQLSRESDIRHVVDIKILE